MFRLIKNILIPLCAVLVLGEISLMAIIASDPKFKQVKDDKGTVNEVTVTFVNETSYQIWLETDTIGIPRGLIGRSDYYFTDWIGKGTTIKTNNKYAPSGTAWLHFKDPSGMDRNETVKIQLDGNNNRYYPYYLRAVKEISIEAKPVLMFYPNLSIANFYAGQAKEGPWVYPFYNYTITIRKNDY